MKAMLNSHLSPKVSGFGLLGPSLFGQIRHLVGTLSGKLIYALDLLDVLDALSLALFWIKPSFCG